MASKGFNQGQDQGSMVLSWHQAIAIWDNEKIHSVLLRNLEDLFKFGGRQSLLLKNCHLIYAVYIWIFIYSYTI